MKKFYGVFVGSTILAMLSASIWTSGAYTLSEKWFWEAIVYGFIVLIMTGAYI